MRRVAAAYAALVLYALGLLSIGLTRDWRLMHEDNGALQTTLALSHLRLGLGATRAHDLFYNPHTGEGEVYGHHPPGTALLLAGAFALAGSEEPAVARAVAILFHLGSLLLLVGLLRRYFSGPSAWLGGFFTATVPMSSFFGRMMNYEPLGLFAVLLQLTGFVHYRERGVRTGLGLLALGVLLGGLIDWPSFLFAAAIAAVALHDRWRRRPGSAVSLGVVVAVAAATLVLDLWHLRWAAHGSLAPLRQVLSSDAGEVRATAAPLRLLKSLAILVDIFRRYYTHAGLVSSTLVSFALMFPRARLSRGLLAHPGVGELVPVLAVMGGAPAIYVLSAPGWATVHAYWQFYFLPFAACCMTLVVQFLWRRASVSRRSIFGALLALFVGEVALTSAFVLHQRHTKLGGYAMRQANEFRETYLRPETRSP